ncbi:MAG: hypothetical protein JWL97_4511 [Gemmatimonadales bacterium]|nr:hypothetical protein [Gemmatimonadales bacterium]
MNGPAAAITAPPDGTQCPQCPHTHPAAEAAQLIGMAERTLLDKAYAGQVPSTKPGREVRFTDDDIAKIIAAAGRRPATPRRRAGRRS